MLQSQTVDLARAVDLVNALVQTLKDHRQESFFDKLWDEALTICEHYDSASLASQTHIRKMSGLALLHWQCGRDKRLSFKFPLHAIG